MHAGYTDKNMKNNSVNFFSFCGRKKEDNEKFAGFPQCDKIIDS